MKKIAVVLLNYNSSVDCDKCIEFLLKQTYPIERIIVVDNNSSIKDVEMLKRICKKSEKIELILNKENRGFSAGNRERGTPLPLLYYFLIAILYYI